MKNYIRNVGGTIYFYWMFCFQRKKLNKKMEVFANAFGKALSNAISDIPFFNPFLGLR